MWRHHTPYVSRRGNPHPFQFSKICKFWHPTLHSPLVRLLKNISCRVSANVSFRHQRLDLKVIYCYKIQSGEGSGETFWTLQGFRVNSLQLLCLSKSEFSTSRFPYEVIELMYIFQSLQCHHIRRNCKH